MKTNKLSCGYYQALHYDVQTAPLSGSTAHTDEEG